MSNEVLRVVKSVLGHDIRITFKQWAHATEAHDYMSGNIDKVVETLNDPDSVIGGREGEYLAMRAYASTNITRKTSVVVYRDEPDGFLITAFFTSKPQKVEARGDKRWSRSQ